MVVIQRRALLGAGALLALTGAATLRTERSVFIQGATVFDGTGTPPYAANIVVRNGRIAEIGPQVQAPQDAQVIDARGKSLLPGLFDVHTHWTGSGEPATTPDIATAYIQSGVTTVNDFHQAPETFEPRRRWLATLASPHVNLTARISTPGGHGADWADQNTTRWANTPEGGRAAVTAIAPYRPDLIKVFADGWRYGNAPDNTSMNEPTLQAIVEAAHARGLKVVTHTVTAERGAIAARAGVDLIVHSIQDREIDPATAALMRDHAIAYAPTLAVYEPVKPGASAPANPNTPRTIQIRRKFAFAQANVRLLAEAGVPVVVGTDAGMTDTPHGRSTLRELELLVEAGLTPTQALIAGTSNAARAMGVLDDRGTIERGKRADLLLVDGSPWLDITAVRKTHAVLIDGRLVHGPDVALAAANLRPLMPAITVAPLIDDFERKDGRTRLNTLRTDDYDGGEDRTVMLSQIITQPGGNRILSVSARMSHKASPYAGVIFPFSRGGVEPADLSAWQGIRLKIRGDDQPCEIRLRDANGAWRTAVPAGAEWRTITVPFDRLTRDSSGDRAPSNRWTGREVFDLRISGSRTDGERLWFEVDEISLY